MREYAKVAPQFWTGETGRAILDSGPAVTVVAFHLMSGPSASWLGLYHLPIPVLAFHCRLTIDEATAAILTLSALGFAHYDTASEYVFLPEMARIQIADRLVIGEKGPDKRIHSIVRELLAMRKLCFVADFIGLYRERFNLERGAQWDELRRAIEGAPPSPVKPLRSQEPIRSEQEPPPIRAEHEHARAETPEPISPEFRGETLQKAMIPALVEVDPDHGLVLLPRLKAHSRKLGCSNPDLAWRHWHAKRWANRNDPRTWRTSWYSDFEAWMLAHATYPCPCQRRRTEADKAHDRELDAKEQGAQRRGPRPIDAPRDAGDGSGIATFRDVAKNLGVVKRAGGLS